MNKVWGGYVKDQGWRCRTVEERLLEGYTARKIWNFLNLLSGWCTILTFLWTMPMQWYILHVLEVLVAITWEFESVIIVRPRRALHTSISHTFEMWIVDFFFVSFFVVVVKEASVADKGILTAKALRIGKQPSSICLAECHTSLLTFSQCSQACGLQLWWRKLCRCWCTLLHSHISRLVVFWCAAKLSCTLTEWKSSHSHCICRVCVLWTRSSFRPLC